MPFPVCGWGGGGNGDRYGQHACRLSARFRHASIFGMMLELLMSSARELARLYRRVSRVSCCVVAARGAMRAHERALSHAHCDDVEDGCKGAREGDAAMLASAVSLPAPY